MEGVGDGGGDVGEIICGEGVRLGAVLELGGGAGVADEVELFEARVGGGLAFAVRVDGELAEAGEGLRGSGVGVGFAEDGRVVASGGGDVGGMLAEGGGVAAEPGGIDFAGRILGLREGGEC